MQEVLERGAKSESNAQASVFLSRCAPRALCLKPRIANAIADEWPVYHAQEVF
jgi:hypothetical protein